MVESKKIANGYKLLKLSIFIFIPVIVYVTTFLIFYPPYYIVSDGQHYLRSAYLLLKGKLWIDDDMYRYSFLKYGDIYVSRYPPGMSLLLLPFIIFGWRYSFLLNLILFLLSSLMFYKILENLGLNRRYSFLFMLYPGFIFFVRNILPEIPSVFFILTGFYFYTKRRYFLSSLFFSASFLIRYTNFLIGLPFILIPVIRNRKNIRLVLPPVVFVLISIFTYNFLVFGNPFLTGYHASGEATRFGINYTIPHLIGYLYVLLVSYPLMGLSPIFFKSDKKKEIMYAYLLYIVIISSYYYTHIEFKPQDVIIGVRYMVPVIPLLIISYADFYERFKTKIIKNSRISWIFDVSLISLLLMVYIFSSKSIYDFQMNRYNAAKTIYNSTTEGSLIVGDGCEFLLLEEMGDRKFLHVSLIDENLRQMIKNKYEIYTMYCEQNPNRNNLSVRIEKGLKITHT